MKPITNIALSIDIESGNAAFVGSLEEAEAELCRLLDEAKKKISGNMHPEDRYNLLEQALHDINGNPCGTVCITTEVDETVVDDVTEWCNDLREEVESNGFPLASQTMYDLDEAYELDPDAVNEWFSNRTDAAITAGEVVPEASGWEFS